MKQRRTLHSPSAYALVLLCCLTANGCDSRQLIAPQTRTIAPPSRDASDGGALIGAAAVAADQTAGVSLGPVPEFTYVLVQVGGQYDGQPNPACTEQPPSWPCIFNAPASDFYDLAPYTTGPVQAWVVTDGSLSSIPLRGSGGALNTPGQAIGLYYGESTGELRVRASVNDFVSQNPNPEGGVPSWIISGAYSVFAVEINPLTFNGGPTGDPDGTVTFSVAPTAPLTFINPDGVSPAAPPGDPSWYFVPGESVPAQYGPGAAYPIDACFRQTTCRYTPPTDVNGRMQVVAYVENRIVIGRSDYVRACQSGAAGGCDQDDPKLVLRCDGRTDTDSVTRGARMECTASLEPAAGATVTDVRWEFRDAYGDTIPGPTGEMRWGGTMVVGGQMTVSGTVNGSPQAPTLAVTVTKRTWPRIGVTVTQGGHGRLPPVTAMTAASQLMQTRWDTIPPSTLPLMTISDGPNAGWAYLSPPVRTLPLVVDVSDAWQHGSVWYNVQHGGPTGN